jgi:hypothetical protein
MIICTRNTPVCCFDIKLRVQHPNWSKFYPIMDILRILDFNHHERNYDEEQELIMNQGGREEPRAHLQDTTACLPPDPWPSPGSLWFYIRQATQHAYCSRKPDYQNWHLGQAALQVTKLATNNSAAASSDGSAICCPSSCRKTRINPHLRHAAL